MRALVSMSDREDLCVVIKRAQACRCAASRLQGADAEVNIGSAGIEAEAKQIGDAHAGRKVVLGYMLQAGQQGGRVGRFRVDRSGRFDD